MAIKIYKSQIAPTAESSNVANKAFINPQEAASIGNAWKGMVKSGQELYVKHQDIKTDNEVLEKQKEVMNGTENSKGLTEISTTAGQMNDPDKAGAYYNSEWQRIFDRNSETLSGKMAQRKFKSLMTKQNINDVNSIKQKATGNMISSRRVNELDRIETLKKSIIFGQTEEERQRAVVDLDVLLKSSKTKDIFGKTLTKVNQKTKRDIAFYGYKNVAIADRIKALAQAQKDDRLDLDDINKLQNYFKTKGETSTKLINSEVTKMDQMALDGIIPDIDQLNNFEITANALNKPVLSLKIKRLKNKINLVQSLNLLTPIQIENFVTEQRSKVAKNKSGTSTESYEQLKVTEDYLAKLKTDLNKDPIRAVSKRGTFDIETIDFQEFSRDVKGNLETFKTTMVNRKSQSEAISKIYGVNEKFLSETEATQITSVLKKMDNAEEIKYLSQIVVEGFGNKASKVFAQLQEKDQFLAHIGGLSIVSNASGFKENKAIDLAIEGYLLNKQENLDIKVKDTDIQKIKAEYNTVFPENIQTFNNIVETANNIYAAMHFGTSKYKSGVFDTNTYEKAIKMSMGQNGDYGGVNEYNDNKVHVPMWLKNNDFEDFVDWLKEKPDMLAKASGTEIRGEDEFDGEFLPGNAVGKYQGKIRDIKIFEGGDPYLVSVGYGKYKVAMQDHPSKKNGDPRYALDGNFAKEGNNHFIIDFNKVRLDWGNKK